MAGNTARNYVLTLLIVIGASGIGVWAIDWARDKANQGYERKCETTKYYDYVKEKQMTRKRCYRVAKPKPKSRHGKYGKGPFSGASSERTDGDLARFAKAQIEGHGFRCPLVGAIHRRIFKGGFKVRCLSEDQKQMYGPFLIDNKPGYWRVFLDD